MGEVATIYNDITTIQFRKRRIRQIYGSSESRIPLRRDFLAGLLPGRFGVFMLF